VHSTLQGGQCQFAAKDVKLYAAAILGATSAREAFSPAHHHPPTGFISMPEESVENTPVNKGSLADAPAPADLLCRFQRQQARRQAVRFGNASERIAKLRRLKAAILAHRDQLVAAMTQEFHKPRMEVELSEVQLVLTELGHTIRHLRTWMRPARVPTPIHLLGTRSEIRCEPRGLVLILAAWNYPFALLFAPLVAAIAAGNCVMLRGSERVPLTNAVAERILSECFDPDEVSMVRGDLSVAASLVELPFDHIFFTGTAEVARRIMAASAPRLTSLTLELGGKSPVIVDESADIATAAERITWGKFFNAGQTCVAPDYVLVHAARADELCASMRSVIKRFYGENDSARRGSSDLCRIIDERNFNKLRSLLEDAVGHGARVEIGGHVDADERYIAPTVLSCVPADCAIMQEEIFGPILPVLAYQHLDEAIKFVNGQPKPLALYVFSRRGEQAERILRLTSAGGTVINNVVLHLLNPDLPFGGVGMSGMGSYHGRFGFRAFSHERAIMMQGRFNPASWFYPPYARLYNGVRGWLARHLGA